MNTAISNSVSLLWYDKTSIISCIFACLVERMYYPHGALFFTKYHVLIDVDIAAPVVVYSTSENASPHGRRNTSLSQTWSSVSHCTQYFGHCRRSLRKYEPSKMQCNRPNYTIQGVCVCV